MKRLDYSYIDCHVKDITKYSFVVFITEPLAIERKAELIPYFYWHPNDVAKVNADGVYELNGRGYNLAERVLTNLVSAAEFFIGHKEEFEPFLNSFHEEYERRKAIVQEARQETKAARDACDWRREPILLRKQMALEKELNSLYSRMYKERFPDGVFFDEDEILELQAKLKEQNESSL